MSRLKLVNQELLTQTAEAAKLAPRLRKNHNLHHGDNSRCHRLLNAMEPLSYIRPHRHLDIEKDEAFILMQGRLGIIIFDDDGNVTETALLDRSIGNFVADISHGVFHTAVSLESGTVFFETKAGPYLPLTDQEQAPWAPADNNPAAASCLESLKALFS